MPIQEYLAQYDELVRILQIEHIDAVRDLAASMGKIGCWDDSEVQQVLDDVCRKKREAGKKLGVSYGPCDSEMLKRWKARGVNMISISSDANFIAQGSTDTYRQVRAIF